MSQEFEKIVLEKLNGFEGRFNKIDKTLGKHTDILNEHTEILKDHSEKIAKNTEEIIGLTEVVQYHTNMITKFDYEFRKKIDTVFDAYNHLNNKIDFDKVSGSMLKSEIFQHEVRISSLENKIQKSSATA